MVDTALSRWGTGSGTACGSLQEAMTVRGPSDAEMQLNVQVNRNVGSE